MEKVFGILIILVAILSSCKEESPIEYKISVPFAGNGWINDGATPANRTKFNRKGVFNLTDKEKAIRLYFRTEATGTIFLGLRAKAPEGNAQIKFSFEGETHNITLRDTTWQDVNAGNFKIDKPGYHMVEITGINKKGDSYGEYKDLLLVGEATNDSIYYVKKSFYWGRRGPSVHMGYSVPKEIGDVEYFYNEITVPKNNDVIGSYFMANGFAEGYFGIQVNSSSERRILFSVWSPYNTNNPEEIPSDQRIQMLKKGDDVYTGKFGSEGSGGQSFLKYNWEAQTTYRFLLRAKPTKENCTDYTAWFMDPKVNKWQLIASFRRPKTSTYIKRPHSFLENFMVQQGNIPRTVNFTNQWACNTKGEWYELTKGRFTADATAHKEERLDYAGGATNGHFFLKNCGFFSDRVTFDQNFEREAQGNKPQIDFSKLP
ncbi:DUF3472 domain-containing protein [Halosquirtibacter laminarini]|uniref:DUF3472 domain-containing protein n=1 Tax=Halosquirtibacter laminarini TaxID=3374600 RepID=A0AC61NIB5_9BACT|nr:DUF3472 domain-containing protein [Prolixibacteraceae bacterium]